MTTSISPDVIDFFRNGYEDKVIVEIGTSLGHGTKVLSGLFKKVITLDNSNEKKKFTLNQFFEPAGSSLVSAHKEDKWYNITRKGFMQIVQPFKKVEGYVEIDVQTQSIDNFCLENNINCIDLLKLDTEGNEFNVLKGAEKFLSENKIKVIYTEISAAKAKYENKVKEIETFLKRYNFEHVKSFRMPILSFLSGLKASDNLFVHKDVK